jgi:hypothetical protein
MSNNNTPAAALIAWLVFGMLIGLLDAVATRIETGTERTPEVGRLLLHVRECALIGHGVGL